MNQPHNLPFVNIADLRKSFGNLIALDGLSFHLNKGDIYGLLGPNGSGKSTTIRILLSLIRADSGSVNINSMDIRRYRKEILSNIGVLIERPNFYEHLSAKRNLSLLLKYCGKEHNNQAILETLKLVGLEGREKDKVSNYSEGMKQRLGIAQAIIHQPELLILDEPFNNLDPQGVKDIRDLIIKLNKEFGVTFLISSHKLDEIEKLVNRLVLISRGKAVAEGKIQDLVNQEKINLIIEVDDPGKAISFLKKSKISVDNIVINSGIISLNCSHASIPDITEFLIKNKIKIYRISHDNSLESLFLSFTKT